MMERPVALWFVAFALLITGCAPAAIQPVMDPLPAAQIAKHHLLVGTWLEEYTSKEGLRWRQFTNFYSDGSYRYQFRNYHADGGYDDLTEYGEWGMSGDIFFTVERHWMDQDGSGEDVPGDPSNYSAATILTLTPDKFVYKNVRSGLTFTAKRVPEDYRLPETP